MEEHGKLVYWQVIPGVWIIKEVNQIIFNTQWNKARILFSGENPSSVQIWDVEGDYTNMNANMNAQQWLPMLETIEDTKNAMYTLWPREKKAC